MIFENTKPALSADALAEAEQRLGFIFPTDYREFLLRQNGGRPTPSEFAFTDPDGDPSDSLVDFFYSIYDGTLNNLELKHRTFTLGERMPPNIVPIANDPFGNQICMSVAGDDVGRVYFWDHELETGEPTYENMSLIANSFTEFLSSLE
jgi:cell wall assembly regulator SMI1